MRARRSAARSSFVSTSPRTFGSRVNFRIRSTPSARSAFTSARPRNGRREQRQHVVAVHPLVLALVDLDQVLKAEQPLQERPVPDEIVEGGEQHRRRRRPVQLGGREDVERSAAVVDRQLAKPPLGDEGGEVAVQARSAALQPPVLPDRRLGQRTSRPDRQQRKRSQRLLLGRHGRLEPLLGITRSVRS